MMSNANYVELSGRTFLDRRLSKDLNDLNISYIIYMYTYRLYMFVYIICKVILTLSVLEISKLLLREIKYVLEIFSCSR